MKPDRMLDEEFHKAPFIRILLPLVAGIVLGRSLPAPGIWICLGISMAVLFFSLFARCSAMIPVLLAFLCFGLLLGREAVVPVMPEGIISARICDEVNQAGNGRRTIIDRIQFLENGRWKKVGSKASVYFKSAEGEMDLQPGTYILGRGKLAAYDPAMNPHQFDYGAFQRGRGIAYQIYLDASSWKVIEQDAFMGLKIRSLCFRRNLIERLESRITGANQRAILNSLLLGYREELDRAVKQNFACSGSMHILAVSGLHVGILYLLPALLLRRIKAFAAVHISGNILVFAGLWMYAFLTGLSPSVVRAVCMCCIHGLAVMSGRKVSSLHVVSFAAFIMILARPAVVFEAGFQMSFAAVTGIIFLYRRFLACFPFPGWFGIRIARMLSVSLSAQLAVMPLLIFYFNQFSVVSLLANLVVVPLATVILYTGFCFFLFGGLEFIAGYTASMLQWMSSFLDWFTLSLSSLPGACVDGLSLIPLQVFVIFFTGIFLLLYLRSRSVRSFILILSGVILFLAITCVREYRILTHHRFYVFSLSRETAIGFVRGRQITLFRGFDPGEDKDTLPYELISFFKRYKLYPPLSFSVSDPGQAVAEFPWYRYIDVAGMEAVYIEFKHKRMLLISRLDEEFCEDLPHMDADILVLCNNLQTDIPAMLTRFNASRVIADGSMYPSFVRKIETACKKEGIRFHSTKKLGFFSY